MAIEGALQDVGLADIFTRRDIRAPGEFVVSVDGDERARVQVGVEDAGDDLGWIQFSFATEPGTTAAVTFAATALGEDARQRLICFAAQARTSAASDIEPTSEERAP